jgi:FAD/FMN-containing dehydrogenase
MSSSHRSQLRLQLVLANGEILNVTKKTHPDLFWGMRGAGITFGVVTRFELKTFDLGEIWGGASVFAHEHETAILDAFNKFIHACRGIYDSYRSSKRW